MKFDIVVAADEGNGIGCAGAIPWHLPGDLAFLKRITTETSAPNLRNAVIMGRKTWETIPPRFQPLPRRLNIVVSRQQAYDVPDGVIRTASVAEALERAADDASVEQVFVLGGAEIYRIAIDMPECRRIYLTRVEGHFDADARFPEVPVSRFHLAEVSPRHEENGVGYAFQRWERV